MKKRIDIKKEPTKCNKSIRIFEKKQEVKQIEPQYQNYKTQQNFYRPKNQMNQIESKKYMDLNNSSKNIINDYDNSNIISEKKSIIIRQDSFISNKEPKIKEENIKYQSKEEYKKNLKKL